MSYDLMVFEKTKAPVTRNEFIAWYEKQTEWSEDHDYQNISVSSPSLKNWFMEMIKTFPPMNGEYYPNLDPLDEKEAEKLELHLVDYSIGHDMIYASFSWSVAQEAYEHMRKLAVKYDVGFFDVSEENGDVIFPNGTKI